MPLKNIMLFAPKSEETLLFHLTAYTGNGALYLSIDLLWKVLESSEHIVLCQTEKLSFPSLLRMPDKTLKSGVDFLHALTCRLI